MGKWLRLGGFICCCIPASLLAREPDIHDVQTHINGRKVQFVIEGDRSPDLYCAMQIDYGDGSVDEIKVNRRRQTFPFIKTRVYELPGTYTVRVEGITIEPRAACRGSVTKTVTIAESAMPKEVSIQTNRPPAVCPSGWQKVSENTQTGAFTCQVMTPQILCNSGTVSFKEGDVVGCRNTIRRKK